MSSAQCTFTQCAWAFAQASLDVPSIICMSWFQPSAHFCKFEIPGIGIWQLSDISFHCLKLSMSLQSIMLDVHFGPTVLEHVCTKFSLRVLQKNAQIYLARPLYCIILHGNWIQPSRHHADPDKRCSTLGNALCEVNLPPKGETL
eukprot:14333-Heterococcus_DN1.PRE.4